MNKKFGTIFAERESLSLYSKKHIPFRERLYSTLWALGNELSKAFLFTHLKIMPMEK
jgi:hypothetical protein